MRIMKVADKYMVGLDVKELALLMSALDSHTSWLQRHGADKPVSDEGTKQEYAEVLKAYRTLADTINEDGDEVTEVFI